MTRWHNTAPFLPDHGRKLALGLGLIGIGKPWGHTDTSVPTEDDALDLLRTAFDLGLRYLDTAPSYGISEQRVSHFFAELTGEQRAQLVVATKFGEHWDAEKAEPFVDHSYDALTRSLDGSLERLGAIDFLQLHKTTPAALASPDVERAFRYAQSLGIRNLGASVSDVASAELALATGMFSILQCPLNPTSQPFLELATRASSVGFLVAGNRPFGMGALLYGDAPTTPRQAFAFLAAQPWEGVVLTGTKSSTHLRTNWQTFHQALT